MFTGLAVAVAFRARFWNIGAEGQLLAGAMAAAFVSQQWSLDIPMMEVVDFFHLDDMPVKRRRWMHHYRELVKRQLLLNGGDKIHLSKNPVMSGWVDALIETFPDARIVVMMRNPTECIPSCLKLVQVTWRGKGWQPEEYEHSLELLTEISFEHFEKPRRVLARHPQTPQIIMDYRKPTTEPRETVHAVYQALDIGMSEQFDSWLQAQAERERQSRIILGTAETEIAEKFARASEHYRDNPVALHLRAMNMVYEGLRQKGSMIIVPSTAVETMGLGALGGLTAFGKGLEGGPAASEPAADATPTPNQGFASV